jgi:hypothetical protein
MWALYCPRRAEEGADGARMHWTVPAERWCVTKKDLKFLRQEVIKGIENGTICPRAADPSKPWDKGDLFDPQDRIIGPNMYTVNDQYIKPVTAEAGNMSWALMQNRDGLSCDLFITHGWKEGAFEFIDKA